MPPKGKPASLILAVLLAGCLGSSSPDSGDDSNGSGEPFSDTTGAIEGLVTDDSLAPIPGALVSIPERGQNATTDAAGRFVIRDVAPGAMALVASREGFLPASQTVSVEAGRAATVSLSLVALPSTDPYYVTQLKEGRMLCAAATRPSRFVLNACGLLTGTAANSTEKSLVIFYLTAPDVSQMSGIVFETRWVPSQVFGRGLEVYWETNQEITPIAFSEPVRQFARVNGTSPLRGEANETQIQKIIHAEPPPRYCHAGDRCSVLSRAFPFASTLGPSTPADVAFYVDQRFTHFVTEFYFAQAPPGFSVVQDT